MMILGKLVENISRKQLAENNCSKILGENSSKSNLMEFSGGKVARAENNLRQVQSQRVHFIVLCRDVPECVFEFRPEPELDFQFRPEPDRNFDCAILHLRNMFFALYHHLCCLFIQKGCSPNSETYMKKIFFTII